MKRPQIVAAMAVAILLFISRVTYAGVANGTYYNDFTGVVPLWDISGIYSGDAGVGLGLDFSLSEEPSGNFSGDGTVNYSAGYGDVLTGTVNVSGTVKNSNTNPRVWMDLAISGTGTEDAANVSYTISAKVNFGIDSADGELVVVSGSERATVTDLDTGKRASRSARIAPGAAMPLPVGATGGWNLTLNLTPNGTKYTGTATVVTSAGTTAEFTATGSYQSRTDTSKIMLKGAGGSLGLVISTSGSLVNIESVKGKLFGQSVNFKAP